VGTPSYSVVTVGATVVTTLNFTRLVDVASNPISMSASTPVVWAVGYGNQFYQHEFRGVGRAAGVMHSLMGSLVGSIDLRGFRDVYD
jgi:hypothetical protein